jgi:chitodextrinase
LDATSIEKNSAILHGQVIDDGRELCQVRFQYGKTTNYEIAPNPPWEVGPGGVGYASGETFGKFISGLEEGVTYHFRAQIKNSAGLVSGADKTFFTQSAPSGWVSPQGFYDPDGKWEEENFAFDDEIGTYARTYRNLGDGVWSSYLYLTREEIVSDRIRFWARELEEVDLVKIDVYRNGSWINVYNGTFPDYQWVEASFPGGKVSQARIQFHARYSNRYFYYHLYEFDFWKIAEPPSVTTKSATNISSNQATLNGTLNDLGGAHSVEVWLEYGTTSFYRNTTPHYSMSAIGDFSVTVFDLIPATTYHFRAVASSSAGISYGGDKTFTTLGQCNPGATTTCTSEEGCDHIVECPAEGYWPSCPRDECCKLAECLLEGGRSPDCPCPPPPPGYLSPGYGYCTDSCTCNTSTDPGGPCEPWPINRSPNVSKPDETQNFCAWGTSPQVAPGLSITLHWTYSDPDGDLPAGYEVWIDTDSNFHNDDPRFKFKVEGNQSTSYTINLSDNQSTRADKLTYPLSWNTTYYWKVKAKDSAGNWSDWSQVDSFTTPSHAYPYPKFTWSPQRPAVGEVIQFINQSECYTPSGSTTTCASFSWDFENGNPASSNEENPTITFTSITSSTVTLTVTDSPLYQYRCSTSTTFQITYPLPFFKEIPPIFFKMRNFFASLFKIKQ